MKFSLWKKHIKLNSLLIASCATLLMLLGFVVMYYLNTESREAVKVSTITPTSARIPLQVKGSIPYWDQEDAFLSFETNVEKFNYVNLFWYYVDHDGGIETYRYAKEERTIIDFAHANNIKVFAVITNLPDYEGASWDSHRVENAISDDSRRKHIENISAKLKELNFDGLTIDYEEVEAKEKENFSTFIKDLSQVLHNENKLLAVALHPKISDVNKKELIGAFQDWGEIAKWGDHLNIMAYNEHWDESSAGPIASIAWVERIIQYAKQLNIAPQKLFLGIPLYGYDWNKDDESSAEGLTYSDVAILLNQHNIQESWDQTSKSPYFRYANDGDAHEVWFENAESVREKISLAQNIGFAGVTFWRLGGEDPNVWDVVKDFKTK